jgi:phasin family protein
VPFAAGIDTGGADTVAANQPIAEVIEAIAHLSVDEPATSASADEPNASPPIDQTTTAAATAPNSEEERTMTDTMQNTAETMQANAQDAMGKGKQAFEDMTSFGQGNVEAMVESTRVAFKGLEAMTQARAAFAKQSFDATVQTLKSMAEVRSPADLFKLQGEYLRTTMDALVAETSRSTEATLKLVGEIAQPIQNRVALAAEKVRSAA